MTMAMLNWESKVCLTSEAIVLFERVSAYVCVIAERPTTRKCITVVWKNGFLEKN
jgi:hypothetical protein